MRSEKQAKRKARLSYREQAPPLDRVLSFLQLMWAVDHGLQSGSKRMQRTLGVTGMQRLVVRMIGSAPGISAGGLAEALHVHPSTLTGVLDRLEQSRLIERQSDASDRRRSLFRLSAKGLEVDRVQSGTIEEVVRKVIHRISDKQLAAAEEVLKALADGLVNFA
jgi:DNA-binding MarR family transcriptional regulator